MIGLHFKNLALDENNGLEGQPLNQYWKWSFSVGKR